MFGQKLQSYEQLAAHSDNQEAPVSKMIGWRVFQPSEASLYCQKQSSFVPATCSLLTVCSAERAGGRRNWPGLQVDERKWCPIGKSSLGKEQNYWLPAVVCRKILLYVII